MKPLDRESAFEQMGLSHQDWTDSQWLGSGALEEAPLLEWKICLLLLFLPDISCLHLRSGSTLSGSAELE